MTLYDLIPVLPELALTLSALALLILGAHFGDASARAITNFSALLCVVIAIMVGCEMYGSPDPMTAFSGAFVSDSFTGVLKILVLIASAVSLIMARGWLENHHIARPEYAILTLLSLVGMMVMISANNMLVLYIGLEIQSLSLYILAAFQRDNLRSTEAGLKYFILGALSSGILLYGISILYGFTGSIEFSRIAEVAATSSHAAALSVGLLFVLTTFFFKISAAPFHMWAPDVYEGAPTPVTAFFTVAPKLAAMGLLIRLLFGPFMPLMAEWQPLIVWISGITMIIGALAGISQDNIKRLFVYSSIGQVGFALMGIASGTHTGLSSVIMYFMFYLVMTLGSFSIVLSMRRNGKMVEGIPDLAGIARVHPGMTAVLTILMFSMAGIPPLVGFFTKLYVLLAAMHSRMIFLALIGAISSVVSAYYYLRIIKVMYFDELVEGFDDMEPGLSGVAVVSAALTVAGFALMWSLTTVAHFALHSMNLPQ